MIALIEALKSLQFTFPLFLLLIPVLLLVAFVIRYFSASARNRGYISVSALQDTAGIGIGRARYAHGVRFACVIIMVVGVSVLLAGPTIDMARGTTVSRRVELSKTIITVFDISGSMRGRFTSKSSSKFDLARDSLVIFLEDQENIRAGIIFYSHLSFQYRRPTGDIDVLADDLRRLSLAHQPLADIGEAQLSQLAGVTETARALMDAAEVMENLPGSNTRSRALILISDLIDNNDEMFNAAKQLSTSGIRVFVLSIKNPRPTNPSPIEVRLGSLPRVHVFVVSSPEDMRQVYGVISDIEREEVVVRERSSNRKDMRWDLAASLFVVSVVFALGAEIVFRRMRGG